MKIPFFGGGSAFANGIYAQARQKGLRQDPPPDRLENNNFFGRHPCGRSTRNDITYLGDRLPFDLSFLDQLPQLMPV